MFIFNLKKGELYLKLQINKKAQKVVIIGIFFLFIASSILQVTGKLYTENIYSTDLINSIDQETLSHIRIEFPNGKTLDTELLKNGYDILFDTIKEDSLELIVNSHELNTLTQQGLQPFIIEKGKPFSDKQIQYECLQVPPDYPDLSEIYDVMTTADSSYPSICKMFDLTDAYDSEPTFEGRHLYALKISDNVDQEEDEPAFLMVSCHHCRETVTPVIALYAIEQLTSNYGSDPQITSLIDEYEIWICPVWNPDGYEYVFTTDDMWRKNRRFFPEFNSYGVDLNRNYPFGWNASGSGSTDPFSETYKGPSPASESETQTMMVFSNDKNFVKVIDYHSYGREVLYGYYSYSHPFTDFFQSEAIKISTEAGYGGSVRVPSADGEEYQWQIAMNGAYAYLMETHTSFQPSYTSALAEAIQVWPSTLFMLERPISLSGHVTDAITGVPLLATINLSGISFPNGEQYTSTQPFGRYNFILPPGEYDVEFSATGYITQTYHVDVTLESAEILDIELHIPNQAPNAPTIDGPSNGETGTTYLYIIDANDPDADNLYYYIDWGDGDVEEWIGPYDSGEQTVTMHSWSEQGTYQIKVKVKDIYGAESDWSYLEVTMPVSQKLASSSILKLTKQVVNVFW
jgi:hypothetical protein